jgi:hypothetical protein
VPAPSDQDLVAGGGAFHPVTEVVAEPVSTNDSLAIGLRSGASRARTGDLLRATQALSQLSYSPKGVIVRPVYRRPLCILGWGDTKVKGRAAGDLRRGKEKHAIESLAIGSHCVDLVSAVLASHRAAARESAAGEIDANHRSLETGPFALDPEDPVAQIKRHVVAAMLSNGLEDIDAELDRLQRDRGLGDVSLAVGRQHLPILARAV